MPELLRVSDPDDPRIAAFRDIRERDLVGRRGLFVAEGTVVLDVLAGAAAFEPLSMLVLENRLGGLADLLERMPAGLPVHVADAKVMDAIAGFPMHRGVLAIGRQRTKESPDDLLASLPNPALVVVLVGISNHDNVGAIFRNAAAFGADAVFLDPTCCDPLYRKAIRVSVGGVFRVPFARFADEAAFVASLLAAAFRLIALSPAGASDIVAVERPDRAALFLGTEGTGLPDALLERVPSVRISIAPGFDSLNVAAASAIALHRLSGWSSAGEVSG
jgi:tRNA G18 (ribose-2'-O)-methylase SpoU